ncbi:MAG: 23S rRNA (adenine(2503)-C(2))-methyltransferase RlmN [Fimbriimonadaceae bacterium]|nr:23S rRNA (adenine(2503)-C(2))-methyltransferase RlmN [Fimbriimonadaceae bacterium]
MNIDPTAPLLGRSTAELSELLASLDEPSYRGRQLAAWLYRHGARSFAEMTNLSAGLRARLADRPTGWATVAAQQVSVDGTAKLLLELADGARVETVGLPYPDRCSVCVSSQTGCAVGCTFCATGYLGAGRNLTAGEIVEQVLAAQHAVGRRVSHVVFMGMGEPLLNLAQVLVAVRLLHEEVGLAQRHLTISTVGLPPQLQELAAADLQVTLAVSLHAADDALRQQLIPTTARRWSVAEVLAAARLYRRQSGRRLTWEVVLLRDVNDGPSQAAALVARLQPGEHVNLIPFNPVGEAGFGRPTADRVRAFRAVLERAGLQVTQRQARGRDIDGACGQLRARAG